MRRFSLLLLASLLAVGIACGSEQGEPKPLENVDQVELPMNELEVLRARIKQTLTEIHQICEAQGITSQQIWDAFHSTDWNDTTVDRLSAMPDAIRAKMLSLRADLVRHHELVVAAYDDAEAVAPAEQEAK